MKWSNTKPTEAGWYWARDDDGSWESAVYEVVAYPDGLMLDMGDGCILPIRNLSGQWAGPIPPPEGEE